MATFIQFERKWLVLLALLAMLATMALATARPARATAGDCYYSAGVEVINFGSYELLKGTKGNDWINCAGSDVPVEIRGGAGDDDLYGSQYNDVIKGGWGDDYLQGYGGDDWLLGGQDDDYMDGGAGAADTCLGGRGVDSFGSIGGNGCEVSDPGRQP